MYPDASPIITVDRICKAYDGRFIFSDFSLSLKAGSRTALFGASGIGKTTLLNLILGLAAADQGKILTDQNAFFSVVFQENRLFTNSLIIDNLDIFPERLNVRIAETVLSNLGFDREDIFHKKTSGCSGGMKRRIAIGRALYACCLYSRIRPVVLVMDEPFQGLDADLKNAVIDYTNHIVSDTRSTLLFVTHEKEEAAALGCGLVML